MAEFREPSLPRLYKPGADKAGSIGIGIYGRSGAGKTSLIGTMPGKGLIIDTPTTEGGTFVLADRAQDIDVVPVLAFNDIEPIYDYLSRAKHEYRYCAIDSLTGMLELAKRRATREQEISADPHLITQAEWGKIGSFLAELIFKFRQLPISTVMIAQERTRNNDDGNTITGPDVTPSILSALLPSLMLVGHLSVEQTDGGTWERRLRIGPHPNYYTKVRALPSLTGKIPSIVRNPNLSEILKFLLGAGPAPQSAPEPTTGFSPIIFSSNQQQQPIQPATAVG